MKLLLAASTLLLLSVSSTADQDQEILFNSDKEVGVLELFTDPSLAAWEKETMADSLCYQGDVTAAQAELVSLVEQGVLFQDEENGAYLDSGIIEGQLVVTLSSSKMADEGEDPEYDAVIPVCRFDVDIQAELCKAAAEQLPNNLTYDDCMANYEVKYDDSIDVLVCEDGLLYNFSWDKNDGQVYVGDSGASDACEGDDSDEDYDDESNR